MKRLFTMVNAVLISMALGAAQPSVITIATAEDLFELAQKSQTDTYASTQIRLEADIDLSTVSADWMPIGNAERPFSGDFNGNNHVVYNLYMLSSSFTSGVGLFAETSETAVVHHLGLAQGQIMTDGASNIAAFIGINRGKLHHCFNMLQIIAHNGNNVGGLVGRNAGEIAYCYNAGIITDGNSNIGGLVGYNEASARLNECYNMGYCKGSDHVGALFGKNEAPESRLTKVVFDQQLTRIYATGDGGNDAILKDNTKYAIEKSSVFIDKISPFYEDPEHEWHYESAGVWSHPQLLCFKDHPASHVSVKAIWLDTENRPIMRAEGVGAPTESNGPRGAFKLEQMNHSVYGKGNWSSASPDAIYIDKPTSELATVHRPCGNQEVILSVRYDKFVKQIYTIVKGYDTFDAGIASGHAYACWQEEGIGFKDNNKDGKEASGGRDDEQKNERLSYQYRIFRDTVIREGDEVTYRNLDVTGTMSQKAYAEWCMPTDVPGEYAFRREVHDTQCKTEWTQTPGYVYLTVRKEFDPGELVEKPDTIYTVLPQTLTIKSFRDASGGSEIFHYSWTMNRSEWNADSLKWLPVPEDTRNPLYIDGELVDAPSFDYTFTGPGTYSFTRRVKEESCVTVPKESKRPHVVVVYEAIKPGSIETFVRNLCVPECTETIHEKGHVTDGDGLYSYRWLCNGEVMEGTDSKTLSLTGFPMQAGNTYVFTRKVKDGTGLSGWVASRGQVTVSVYGDYTAGAVESSDEQICTESIEPEDLQVHIRETETAQGDIGSVFDYCWLLYRGSEDTRPLDTIRYDGPSLNRTIPLGVYGLTVPVTLCIRRAVKNALCEGEWKISEGTSVWRIGRAEKRNETVACCAGELPYDYTYTFADGQTRTYTFQQDRQTYMVQDVTTEGCPLEVTLTGAVTPMPEVEVEPVVSVCQTSTHMTIAFTILSGTPNLLDLTFEHSAHEAGFCDSIGVILPSSGTIDVPLPSRVPLGEQTMTIVFYTDADVPESCRRSTPKKLTFSIDLDGYVRRKGEDILFVDNSGRNTQNGLTFVAYQWYRDGEPLSDETDQFIYEYPSLNGIYHVEMTTEDGTTYCSCRYEMRPTMGLEQQPAETPYRKLLKDGQIVLVVGEKSYTVLGQFIR
ncbi:MAG: hypothetical protein IKP39_00440 [Paludibacteraceae bacterium]|nr:hypothetical protein [Paludibacteraceae bacterium]